MCQGPKMISPQGQIGRWFYPALYFLLLFFSVVLWINAGGRSYPLLERLRAGRYQEISEKYAQLAPADQAERYAVARARHKQGRGPGNWIAGTLRVYISMLGRECQASYESAFLKCLPDRPVSGHLERLAILRGAQFAVQNDMLRLARALRELADPTPNDPLNQAIFTERLNDLRARGLMTEATALADSTKHMTGSRILTARARVVGKAGDLAGSRALFFEAARQAENRYRLRVVLKVIRVDYASMLAPDAPDRRDLLLFGPVLSKSELDSLRVLTPAEIIATTSPARVEGDAFFFLRTLQAQHVAALVDRMYTHLSHEHHSLYRILAQLTYDRNHGVFARIMRKVGHARKAHKGIWRLYIGHLASLGKKSERFSEIAEFLAIHHADYEMYDELMEHLIGSSPYERRWASAADWKLAIDTIPPRTTRGRLLFWYYHYLRQHGRAKEADQIQADFYAQAPGSYYAHAFWNMYHEAGQDADFEKAWGDVGNRQEYLKWVGRYGGNQAAQQFLAKQNFAKYADPRAVELWEQLQSAHYNMPVAILDLARLGEDVLSREFFDQAYEGKLSEVEVLARRAHVGRRTGILYLSVYFTRQLARARGVPEDPFSMPGGLLKSLYPRPYLDLAEKHAGFYKIDPNMVYALMRQESMFREMAVSRSNARGLMQVMPATGRWLAQRLRLSGYDLHKPDTSIRFGSMFLADMLRVNDGDFRWAAIAYNGGPGNLRKWKRRYYRGDLNQFLEFIPAKESRDYCRITTRNYQHYNTTYTLYP